MYNIIQSTILNLSQFIINSFHNLFDVGVLSFYYKSLLVDV
mgnify:CR=1 FL=1